MTGKADESAVSGLVSVIIPAYNRRAYIEQTVESVLQQTYPHVELIVVDDGSTDGTREVLESYARRGRLTLLTHPGNENRGQSASINLGLDAARGEYVASLDSDDFFAPDKLTRQVEFLDANPDVGLVYSNGYLTDPEGNRLRSYHDADHEELNDPDQLLLDCYMALPGSALVRRDVVDRVGRFEEAFRSAQDHDMLLRLAEVTRMAYVPDHLFYYRRHGDSISAKHQDVRWQTGFEILRRAKARYPYQRSTIRKRAAVLHFRMAQVHWRRRRYLHALTRAVRAGLLDPVRSVRVATGREAVR